MTHTTTLFTAAALALATCALHLVGTFMPIPVEQTEVIETVATMQATMVPMPVGAARSYFDILNGNNLGTALLLLVCSLQLVVAARSDPGATPTQTIAVAAVGLVGFSLISATHFFPVPAALTGAAALLCGIVLRGSWRQQSLG